MFNAHPGAAKAAGSGGKLPLHIALEKEHPGDFSKIQHLVRGDNYRKVFQETGEVDEGVWSAGICMGLIDSVPTCQELADEIVRDAEAIITQDLAGMVA